MKKLRIIVGLFAATALVSCNFLMKKGKAITAMTASGKEVQLYANGTWEFTNKADNNKIATTDSIINAADGSSTSYLLKSQITNVSVNLNPEKWAFEKGDGSNSSEYTFTLKKKDAYAMLITERIGATIKVLKEAAISNAQKVSPDVKVVNEEMKTIHGVQVLFMQLEGTLEGIQFTYLGYYYSSPKGSIQFVTYTSQSLLNEYRSDMEELLNGMVITPDKEAVN